MAHLIRAAAIPLLFAQPMTAETFPALNLDASSTTVSGLSSGAFMAVQLQVAFSERIAGAGIVAGGPYGCSEGSVYRALRVCMSAFLGTANSDSSLQQMQVLAEEGRIDDLVHLKSDQIYLFHGQSDDTVARATMDALQQSYIAVGVPSERITYETDIDAGHGFVTERSELDCAATVPDFLIDCDFDQAGDILSHLYGKLSPAIEPSQANLLTFDQTPYLRDVSGMDETGFVYIPETCAKGALCQLHVAFHGCQQGREILGDDYAHLSGYNGWAEANGIVVLYPQAQRIMAPAWNLFGGNPNGCWDWWGYAGDDYLSQNAPQLAAIARMTAALGAPLKP